MFLNRRLKIFVLILMIGIFILGLSAGVLASGPVRVLINGSEISSAVDPIIVKDRLMLPARVIAERLGAEVSWNNLSKTAEIDTYKNIWSNSPDPWRSTDVYNGIIAVSRYLALLQGAVCDTDTVLHENMQNVFSQAVLKAPEPWTIVWYPANITVGSSVRRLNYEIMDARTITNDYGVSGKYEVAVLLKYYDPLPGEPAYKISIKIYTVIREEYTKLATDGHTEKTSHYVIDSEKTVSEKRLDSSQMPDFYN